MPIIIIPTEVPVKPGPFRTATQLTTLVIALPLLGHDSTETLVFETTAETSAGTLSVAVDGTIREPIAFSAGIRDYETANEYNLNDANNRLQLVPAGFSDGHVTTYRGTLWAQYLRSLQQYETLEGFEAGVRFLVSPDVANPLTDEELPSRLIVNPVYLDAAERKVLADTKMTMVDIENLKATNDPLLDTLIYLVQLRVAIALVPQVPQIISEGALQDQTRYNAISVQEKLMQLEGLYQEEISIIEGDDPDDRGNLILGAKLTKSRAKSWLN